MTDKHSETSLKSYPTYKDSAVMWLGKVPTHWAVIPNRGAFIEVNDQNHPHEEMLSVTISRGVIRQSTLLDDSSTKDGSRIDRSSYKLIKPGDIAYNKMRAWQGAIGVSTYQGIISPAYVVERPREGNSPDFLHYLLRTPAFAKEAERNSYGIASDMWSLRPEHFKTIRSCLPPLEEQAAIVRFLDHADEQIRSYIASKERLIALLEEERQALVHQAVTRGLDPSIRLKPSGVEWLGDVPEHWDTRRLRTIAEMRVSNVDKHTKEGETPVRLCNYTDVYKNPVIDQSLDFMPATAAPEEVEKFRIKNQDVLITKDSETWEDIGVPSLVKESAEDLICGYHLAILRPKAEVTGEFLNLALLARGARIQFSNQARGVTRYGLTHNGILSVIVPLPPSQEQVNIVNHLTERMVDIDEIVAHSHRQIDLMNEYRTRLIADVVTGQMDVREAAGQLQAAP